MWRGISAPRFSPASVIGGVHVAPAVTKKHNVAACRACATATIVAVFWMWVPRVDRFVYADETGLPSPRSARTRPRTGFDPARHRASPTTLP